jgi:DtxR family Mn-dependent transcriptional regulator
MQLSFTEENYLKAIYKIHEKTQLSVNTNAISEGMNTTPASVTDMLKKLADKELVSYEKYKGVTLTPAGEERALHLIRKHRLWETFLVNTLHFSWEEVHDIAEELEHIDSKLLIRKLDNFLGNPRFDPHGDPIPDEDGNYQHRIEKLLSEMLPREIGVIVGVKDHSSEFLKYLNQHALTLGKSIIVNELFDYDKSISVTLEGDKKLTLSNLVCKNIVASSQLG